MHSKMRVEDGKAHVPHWAFHTHQHGHTWPEIATSDRSTPETRNARAFGIEALFIKTHMGWQEIKEQEVGTTDPMHKHSAVLATFKICLLSL